MRLIDPWFEAEFYGNVFESVPCSERYPTCCHSINHLVSGFSRQGDKIDGAQGLFLYCPCGFGSDNNVHGLLIPFSNPRNAPELPPNHGPVTRDGSHHPRWEMFGNSLDDLTIRPSVDVGGDHPCWHGFITLGEISNA